MFVIHIETNSQTRIVSYIYITSGLWSNLLRKTTITKTSYFATEEKNVYVKEKNGKCK